MRMSLSTLINFSIVSFLRLPHNLIEGLIYLCIKIVALGAGMKIYALARLLGHADTETLRRYLAIIEADLQRAHHDAAPGDKLK